MTFLEPVPALIAGAIALPALIALYLLKLRRKPLRVSSTMLWEQAFSDLQANVPLRWLRVSWPLVLQILALACLLLAFARPTIPAQAGAAQRTVIVIDASASMSAADGLPPATEGQPPRTRLDQAKSAALALVDDLRRSGAGSRRPAAMIVRLDHAARVLTPFTDDPGALRDAIASITPTDQPSDLSTLLPILRAALAPSEAEAAPDQAAASAVVIFSDGTLEPPARAGLPRAADLRLVRAGPPASTPVDNLGIVAFSARRDPASPSTVRLFVRVLNASDAPRAVSLLVAADGRSVGVIPLTLPGATLAPAQAAGTLELTLPEPALLTVTIPRPDALASDNTAAAVLPSLQRPRVLVVGPGSSTDADARLRGPSGVDRFLLGVLQEMDLANLRVIDLPAWTADRADPARALPFDLIIFDRCAPTTPPSVPTIHIAAAPSDPPPPGLRLLEPDADAARAATRFLSWRRTHPALRHAALDPVLIAPPMRLEIAPPPPPSTSPGQSDEPAAPPRPSIEPLAFGAGGPLIAEVSGPGPAAPRRLVLAFDLLRTNWGPDVSFPVFIASSVEYLTGRGDAAAARSTTTAEPLAVRPAPGATRLSVSGAISSTFDAPPGVSPVALGVPERVGVATVEGAVPDDRTLAINLLSPVESSLLTADSADLLLGRNAAAGESAGALKRNDPARREVWPWFVLAALVLLTLEWFVSAWKMRL